MKRCDVKYNIQNKSKCTCKVAYSDANIENVNLI